MRIYIEQNGFGRAMGALNGIGILWEPSPQRFIISEVLNMICYGYPSDLWNVGTDTCCEVWVTPD